MQCQPRRAARFCLPHPVLLEQAILRILLLFAIPPLCLLLVQKLAAHSLLGKLTAPITVTWATLLPETLILLLLVVFQLLCSLPTQLLEARSWMLVPPLLSLAVQLLQLLRAMMLIAFQQVFPQQWLQVQLPLFMLP